MRRGETKVRAVSCRQPDEAERRLQKNFWAKREKCFDICLVAFPVVIVTQHLTRAEITATLTVSCDGILSLGGNADGDDDEIRVGGGGVGSGEGGGGSDAVVVTAVEKCCFCCNTPTH